MNVSAEIERTESRMFKLTIVRSERGTDEFPTRRLIEVPELFYTRHEAAAHAINEYAVKRSDIR